MSDAAERGETLRADGQHKAYRVIKVDYSEEWHSEEQPRYIATLWGKRAAEELRDAVDPNHAGQGWPSSRIEEVGVVVVGESVFYDTNKPPVPVGLVAESAQEAARDFVAWNADGNISQAVAQLAIGV